jgi:hypothetical protein
MNDMNIHGLSNTFWVVTRPNRVSELGDICFACTFQQFMTQTRGGLHEKEIIGIFADEAEAKRIALKLLGRNVVRISDSIIVEVQVNVLMTPTKRNMTARVLTKAAAEAVGNAVRHAEENGLSHRLRDQVSMGMGEIAVQNHLTLFG